MSRGVLRAIAATGALATIGAVAFASSCSLQNQEGPNVTCAELDCGRINACKEGIIAQCVDGKTVKWHVCGTDDVCTESWQVTDQYRCDEDATDCEGCRPDRTGCTDPELTTSAAAGGTSTTSATTSSTGAGA